MPLIVFIYSFERVLEGLAGEPGRACLHSIGSQLCSFSPFSADAQSGLPLSVWGLMEVHCWHNMCN